MFNRTNNFLTVFLFSILFLSGCKCNNLHDEAVENLLQYMKILQIEYKTYQCGNLDRDANGYISCSYKDTNDQIIQLECAAALMFETEGCREPKLQFPSRE